MALTPRDKRALIMGAGSLAAIALYFAAIEPAANAYLDLTRRHDSAAGRLAMVLRNQQKQAYMAERVREWETKAGTASAPKSYGETVSRIGSAIIAAAQSSKVALQGASPSLPTIWPDDPELQQAQFSIDAQAEWEDVFRFIAAIYRIDGVLSVEQMDLSKEAQNEGKLKLRLNVSILSRADAAGGKRWSS